MNEWNSCPPFVVQEEAKIPVMKEYIFMFLLMNVCILKYIHSKTWSMKLSGLFSNMPQPRINLFLPHYARLMSVAFFLVLNTVVTSHELIWETYLNYVSMLVRRSFAT